MMIKVIKKNQANDNKYDNNVEYDDHDDDQNDQEKNLVRSKVTFSSSMYS